MTMNLHAQKQKSDLTIIITVSMLVIFGLVMVYDSSVMQGLRDFGDSYYYIKQQLIWVLTGLTSAVFFSRFDYNKFRLVAAPLFFISLGLLLAVFIPGLGVSGGGAHRWLKIGGITIQPAEIIKLTGVIYLSAMFEKKTRLLPFIFVLSTAGFITAVLQKDLGSSIVFSLTISLLYFAAGGALWHFALGVPFGIMTLWILIFTSSYRSKRILAFLNPFSDTQGYTYHISQVLIALGAGGITGLGLGQSRQKLDYIPEVTTDSIFAIVGEELGLLGGLFVIILFTTLIFRGIRVSEMAVNNFGKILAIGLTSWLGIQVVINLSSMVALLPLTGVPLPFISYGGSALVANLTAVGILLNISKQATKAKL